MCLYTGLRVCIDTPVSVCVHVSVCACTSVHRQFVALCPATLEGSRPALSAVIVGILPCPFMATPGASSLPSSCCPLLTPPPLIHSPSARDSFQECHRNRARAGPFCSREPCTPGVCLHPPPHRHPQELVYGRWGRGGCVTPATALVGGPVPVTSLSLSPVRAPRCQELIQGEACGLTLFAFVATSGSTGDRTQTSGMKRTRGL